MSAGENRSTSRIQNQVYCIWNNTRIAIETVINHVDQIWFNFDRFRSIFVWSSSISTTRLIHIKMCRNQRTLEPNQKIYHLFYWLRKIIIQLIIHPRDIASLGGNGIDCWRENERVDFHNLFLITAWPKLLSNGMLSNGKKYGVYLMLKSIKSDIRCSLPKIM